MDKPEASKSLQGVYHCNYLGTRFTIVETRYGYGDLRYYVKDVDAKWCLVQRSYKSFEGAMRKAKSVIKAKVAEAQSLKLVTQGVA